MGRELVEARREERLGEPSHLDTSLTQVQEGGKQGWVEAPRLHIARQSESPQAKVTYQRSSLSLGDSLLPWFTMTVQLLPVLTVIQAFLLFKNFEEENRHVLKILVIRSVWRFRAVNIESGFSGFSAAWVFLPWPEPKSQSSERGASVMGLLVSGHTGKGPATLSQVTSMESTDPRLQGETDKRIRGSRSRRREKVARQSRLWVPSTG
ncbi:uncharacterized protein LOC101176134 [Nomascus leucogenys]|uniref:uncharacterized protein LOC101176134 n=1 Tax=Nomascus leucogenys TaxID=61853 RepID=UPI00122DAF7A|nr:uncharacterized protein LOC101176134 [Nomascus leucogenys]